MKTVERESFSALVTGNCKRLVIKTVALKYKVAGVEHGPGGRARARKRHTGVPWLQRGRWCRERTDRKAGLGNGMRRARAGREAEQGRRSNI